MESPTRQPIRGAAAGDQSPSVATVKSLLNKLLSELAGMKEQQETILQSLTVLNTKHETESSW